MYVEQVGGSHYGGSKFQHWDFVLQCNQDYLSAVATKYLARWRDKGGVQDVQKAISYVDKMIAACLEAGYGGFEYKPTTNHAKAHELWPRYLESYPLPDHERGATQNLIFWETIIDLERAIESMQRIVTLEVFGWPELAFLKSKMKPDGWQGFTYEGTKENFSWHRCGVCRAQFKAQIDMPPMLYHTCPYGARWYRADVDPAAPGADQTVRFPTGWHGLTAENGYRDDDAAKPTPAYVNQGDEKSASDKAFDNPHHGHPPE